MKLKSYPIINKSRMQPSRIVTKLNHMIKNNNVSQLKFQYNAVLTGHYNIPEFSLSVNLNPSILNRLLHASLYDLICFLLEKRIRDVESNMYLYQFIAHLIETNIPSNKILQICEVIAKDIDLDCAFDYNGEHTTIQEFMIYNYKIDILLPLKLYNKGIIKLDIINYFKHMITIIYISSNILIEFLAQLPLMHIFEIAQFCISNYEEYEIDNTQFNRITLYLLHRYITYNNSRVFSMRLSPPYTYEYDNSTFYILDNIHRMTSEFTVYNPILNPIMLEGVSYVNEITSDSLRIVKYRGTIRLNRDIIKIILLYLQHSRSDIFNCIQYINRDFHYSVLLDRHVIDCQFYMNFYNKNSIFDVLNYITLNYDKLTSVTKFVLPKVYPWSLLDIIPVINRVMPNLTHLNVYLTPLVIDYDDILYFKNKLKYIVKLFTMIQKHPTLNTLYINIPALEMIGDLGSVFTRCINKYIKRTYYDTSNITHLTIDLCFGSSCYSYDRVFDEIYTLIYKIFPNITSVCYNIEGNLSFNSMPTIPNKITSFYVNIRNTNHRLSINNILDTHTNIKTLYLYYIGVHQYIRIENGYKTCIHDLVRLLKRIIDYFDIPFTPKQSTLNRIVILGLEDYDINSDTYHNKYYSYKKTLENMGTIVDLVKH